MASAPVAPHTLFTLLGPLLVHPWSALSLPCALTHCSSAKIRLVYDTPGRVFPASSTWPSPWSFCQAPGDFLRAETSSDSFLWVPSAAQHRAWY